MPKNTRKPSTKSSDQSRSYPYPESEPKNLEKLTNNDEKEWKEIRCPICLEPPHNPVLLLCSSHEKGCRPYLCYTSPLLSNCLVQYRKSSSPEGLSCPLCRGEIKNQVLATSALGYMNSRPRGCSRENCKFKGTYAELMEHAKKNHVPSSDEVEGSNEARPVSNSSRRPRIRVGVYPRHQLARRTIFPRNG